MDLVDLGANLRVDLMDLADLGVDLVDLGTDFVRKGIVRKGGSAHGKSMTVENRKSEHAEHKPSTIFPRGL